jgi:hypothetical protein
VRLTLAAKPPEFPSLSLALQVCLRYGDADDFPLLDQIEVDAFAGHPGGYSLPHLPDPLGITCKRVTKRMVRDTDAALPWFSNFASGKACLNRLSVGATMHGPAKGAYFQEMAAFLGSLIEKPS